MGGWGLETRVAAGKVGQVIINTQRLTLPGRFYWGVKKKRREWRCWKEVYVTQPG